MGIFGNTNNMIKVVTAIEEDYSLETQSINTKVFIAGGILGCPNWQNEFIDLFTKNCDYNQKVTLFNPRRERFSDVDENEKIKQVCWEYKHLEISDIIVFWFSRGTVNPITLYELGRWGNSQLSNKKILIGIDPEYEKKSSVITQSTLDNPNVLFSNDLESLSYRLIQTICQ